MLIFFSVLNCARELLYCKNLHITKELQDVNKIFWKMYFVYIISSGIQINSWQNTKICPYKRRN